MLPLRGKIGINIMDKDTLFYKKHTIRCKSKLLDISSPQIMGILNLSPDSFYDGGKYSDPGKALKQVDRMINDGASVIDIGAYSSRPGATDISANEEIGRLERIIYPIREKFPDAILSLDTFRSTVAQNMIEKYCIDIINDISGGEIDPEILDLVAEKQTPYICMHLQGTPQDMQINPSYKHVVQDILTYFSNRVSLLRDKGIGDIIIDPGFGFGKTLEQNYQLLAGMDTFQMLEVPILAGLSRKSMIYKLTNSAPEGALTGTVALNLIALQKGASILRVHDVKETKELITIYQKLLTESEKSIILLQEKEN